MIVLIGMVQLTLRVVLIHLQLLMVGCDSVATLNLTINNSSTSSEDVEACDRYMWNGQVYFDSGTYVYMTTTVQGCDSTATLNLTVNNSTVSSQPLTACDSYDVEWCCIY